MADNEKVYKYFLEDDFRPAELVICELLTTYRSGSFLVNIPKRYKFTQANKVVPTSK